jgi:hypothetical protein
MVPMGTRPRSRASSTLLVPLKYSRHLALQRGHHLALPAAREAPAHAEVEQLERVAAARLLPEGAQQRHLGGQPARPSARPAWSKRRKYSSLTMASTWISKPITCTCGPRATISSVPSVAHLDEIALELEDAQEVDEVALDEAQPRR